MLSFFNAEQGAPSGCPQSAMDIVITSFLFAFFGVMMFIGSITYERSYGKQAWWWWTSSIPIAIGALFGLQRVVFLFNDFYASTVTTRKLQICHWLSLFVPILCIAGIFLYKWKVKRNEERRTY
ncbi:MAG: hypothetical protein WCG75_08380 [Armatimonadota bacterium]